MLCPRCGTKLENWTATEGGYCPKCGQWWSPDIIREWIEEDE